MVQFSKHIFMLGLGFGVMIFTSKVKVKFIEVFARLAFLPCIGLLLFTLLYGANINNASRWIEIPFIGINFQSSDLAKVGLAPGDIILSINRQGIGTVNDIKRVVSEAGDELLLRIQRGRSTSYVRVENN